MGLIRLFLAICVLRAHLITNVIAPLHIGFADPFAYTANGGEALLMFYVISGFMISTGLATRYAEGASGTLAFYRGRCVRIFSLYWPVVALALIALPSARTAFAVSNWFDKLSDLAVFGLDWRTWHYAAAPPSDTWSGTIEGVEQSWSLGAEMTFYLLAPWILRSWRLSLAVAAAAAIVRALMIYEFGPDSNTTYLFTPAAVVFFMLGHFARVAATNYKLLKRTDVSIGFLVLAATMGLKIGSAWDTTTPLFWLVFIAFALSLPGMFESTRSNRLMELAGDLSFGVYLSHKIILKVWTDHEIPQHLVPLFGRPHGVDGLMLLALLIATTIVVAALLHFGVERPFGRLLRKLLSSRPNGYARTSIEPTHCVETKPHGLPADARGRHAGRPPARARLRPR
jgi:peptidoglycan/LPS O-acetylase OafA/YrhL